MDKKIKLIYIILTLVLNFSCLEKKMGSLENTSPNITKNLPMDSLKFTSEIRFLLSIVEDNKGELWFGMADGKIFKFNGLSFEKQF